MYAMAFNNKAGNIFMPEFYVFTQYAWAPQSRYAEAQAQYIQKQCDFHVTLRNYVGLAVEHCKVVRQHFKAVVRRMFLLVTSCIRIRTSSLSIWRTRA